VALAALVALPGLAATGARVHRALATHPAFLAAAPAAAAALAAALAARAAARTSRAGAFPRCGGSQAPAAVAARARRRARPQGGMRRGDFRGGRGGQRRRGARARRSAFPPAARSALTRRTPAGAFLYLFARACAGDAPFAGALAAALRRELARAGLGGRGAWGALPAFGAWRALTPAPRAAAAADGAAPPPASLGAWLARARARARSRSRAWTHVVWYIGKNISV
jgi:hypothetical protein